MQGFLVANFHCGLAGENGPVVFGPIGPSRPLTNEDWTGVDCSEIIGRPVNNIASLAQAMLDGSIYVNVQTAALPTGEIRGQMQGPFASNAAACAACKRCKERGGDPCVACDDCATI